MLVHALAEERATARSHGHRSWTRPRRGGGAWQWHMRGGVAEIARLCALRGAQRRCRFTHCAREISRTAASHEISRNHVVARHRGGGGLGPPRLRPRVASKRTPPPPTRPPPPSATTSPSNGSGARSHVARAHTYTGIVLTPARGDRFDTGGPLDSGAAPPPLGRARRSC